jgi:hypothetical protein
VRKKFALEAGQHFIAQYKAERVVFGGDPDDINITPEQALMEEVRRSVAMVRFIQSQIATWNPALGDLGALPALTDETTKGQGTPTDAAEWLRLYRDERAHMVRVSKMTIDAGVSMAMVTLAQQQGLWSLRRSARSSIPWRCPPPRLKWSQRSSPRSCRVTRR